MMSWSGEKGLAGPAGERFKNFERRLVNRRVMPTRHIVVCEDGEADSLIQELLNEQA